MGDNLITKCGTLNNNALGIEQEGGAYGNSS
jgi:hypothetical protein